MFPKLSYLIDYLFGININVSIYTFGFFMALSFILSYRVFYSEFKRKEKLGVIKSYQEFNSKSKIAIINSYFNFGIFGFILGFKGLGIFSYHYYLSSNPIGYFFSFLGNWSAGLIMMLLFMVINFYKRKEETKKPLVGIKHPYELMPYLLFWAAVLGFLGAKIFNLFEKYFTLTNYSLKELFVDSGLTFFGGLVFGAISYLIIGYRRGMKFIDLADIGSPGMLVAYGVGRIGCHLSGDGDWGIINTTGLPKYLDFLPNWLWSFKFPHNVLNAGVIIPNCHKEYCMELSQGVYPTSFYEAFFILLSFLIIWTFRNKIKISGMMFCIYLMVTGLERFLIEFIRVNYKFHFLSFTLSQAQIISFLMLLGGLTGIIILHFRRQPILTI